MRKMKLLIFALLICFALTGLSAVELDYHVGAGLTVPFLSGQATFAFPQAYGGLGVNILPELAVGGEYEVFGLYFFGFGFLMHLPKVYVKYDMSEDFTISALGGVAIPTVFSPDESITLTEGNVGFAGFRATLFFMYAEYLFLVNQEAPISTLSLGVAVKR